MLQVRGISKDFRKFRAVDNLSFDINPGEIVGLLGPNGAGKTTAMRCITGILRKNEGQVLINGFDLDTEMSKAKAGMAFVPELPSLYELLTVQETMKFVAMCYDTMDVFNTHNEELLSRYHLSDKKKELVATLSKGMRQKLSIACAMVHRANVFLFDEPIIGVDPAGVAEIKQDFMDARSRGASILVSTHLLDVAEKLCDRVVILAKGRKLFEGTPDELRATLKMEGQDLESAFLKLTEEVPTFAL